jgi:membrane protease YdiL (CAAX protease family)
MARGPVRQQDLTGIELLLIQGLMDLVLVALIVVIVKGIRRRPLLNTLHWYRTTVFSTAYLVRTGIFLALGVLVLSAFLPPADPTPIERLLTSAESLYLFALFAVGIAPLVEEIIVRGFLFEVLSDLTTARAAVPLTTVLFAGLHIFQLWGNWGAVVLIFCVGYALGFVRYRSGSLISCWIIHATYNSVIFGFAALGMALGLDKPPQP